VTVAAQRRRTPPAGRRFGTVVEHPFAFVGSAHFEAVEVACLGGMLKAGQNFAEPAQGAVDLGTQLHIAGL
jgi:hypothetical protein